MATFIKLITSLGADLKFRSMGATEEMARLFEFNVIGVAKPEVAVDTAALLGTYASVTLTLGNDAKRHFHGVIARAGLESASGKLVAWRLQLRPWLWKLTRRADSRVFQNMTVENILKQVFSQHPGGDVVFDLRGNYPPRLYCVQYRETDFNFVSRLMEEEGMYYFHRHEENKHTLVICDAMTAHGDFPGYAKFKFRESQDQLLDLEAITDWRQVHEMSSGKVVLNEYDYLKPKTPMKVDHASVHGTAKQALEQYDYPGLYTEKTPRGANLARVRMQEHDARVLRLSGHSNTIGAIATGYRFTLEDHPVRAENTNHVVVSTRIDVEYSGYESGQGQSHFGCRFTAMRYAHIFRPDRTTPKPVIPGAQTAVIVGPPGEEIHTDEHGRVKVQFHWDRLGEKNDQSSCWVRVATPLAGKGWGMIHLPRIGQEVVVDFLEGDPDQPIVTGRVYNADQTPPYALPANKTVSTWRSKSTIGGTTANSNELRFEDKKDQEYVWFQAERDMEHLVKRNARTHVRGTECRTVGGNLTEKVGGKHNATVQGNADYLVRADHRLHVNGTSKYVVAGDATLWTANMLMKHGGVKMKCDSWDVSVQGSTKIASTIGLSLKAMKVAIEADVDLSLKVGGNFININPAGVFIQGTLVMINSGGAASPAEAPATEDPSEGPAPPAPAVPQDPLTPTA